MGRTLAAMEVERCASSRAGIACEAVAVNYCRDKYDSAIVWAGEFLAGVVSLSRRQTLQRDDDRNLSITLTQDWVTRGKRAAGDCVSTNDAQSRRLCSEDSRKEEWDAGDAEAEVDIGQQGGGRSTRLQEQGTAPLR